MQWLSGTPILRVSAKTVSGQLDGGCEVGIHDGWSEYRGPLTLR